MTLLIATTNHAKLLEIKNILSNVPITLESLDQHPGIEEAEETGHTFAENARIKAIHYSTLTGQLAVAEDSGLEIKALDGAPGVFSARFNGASYPDKFAAIYELMRKRGASRSTARFVCALSVADGQRITFETIGTIEGLIASAPTGSTGFGYDPIFFYPPYGRTLAEVSAEEKAAVSHRGQAFRSLRTYLQESDDL